MRTAGTKTVLGFTRSTVCKAIIACIGTSILFCTGARADALLVAEGQPRAAIVITENPPRMVDLAARELQAYIRKISGADLPIGNRPDPAYPVTIYIGRSAFTDAQGITDEGLDHGAYLMVSGPDWLVLLGHDRDYEPIEPWPRSHSQYPETQSAWEELYGGPCANPMNYYAGPARAFNQSAGVWQHDEGGSLQAVYAFLRDLGVRWYWPGELGEIVPSRATIDLPAIDRTVKPDFAMRNLYWYNRFNVALRDDVLWWLRLGLNAGSSVLGAGMHVHGMRLIQGNKTMQEAHPEYYALYRGRRDTDYRGTGHACFSSEGLQQATVKYLRAVFDHFDEPAMDLWPMDGYHHCGCELCAGKSPSDLVFGFVDRVAREIHKTHPDKLITCGAYTAYGQPPESIDRFSPNVAVFISNRGRPMLDMPARWDAYWKTIEGWQAKLAPGRLIRGENNLYNQRLVVHPHAYAKDLRALKGISLGDWCEVPRGKPGSTQWANYGINHLNYYVQSRLLWDTSLDLEELLDEYYRLFYGPASAAMRDAWDYAERSYNRMERRANLELPARTEFVARLAAARALAGDTVYGQRIQAIMDELPPLDELRAELQAQIDAGNPRDNTPVVTAAPMADGLEQPTWTFSPLVAWRHRETAVKMPTTFSVAWDETALYFDIFCREPDMAGLNVADNIWDGDSLMVFLETPRHSHYMIQIAPDGRVFDAERSDTGLLTPAWSAMAEVTTEQGDDYWLVKMRLPLAVVGPDEEYGDPLHYVVAPNPGTGGDWFFNIGRTRVRDGRRMTREQGYTPAAFSPAKAPLHLLEVFPPRYFARLVFKQEAGTTVDQSL